MGDNHEHHGAFIAGQKYAQRVNEAAWDAIISPKANRIRKPACSGPIVDQVGNDRKKRVLTDIVLAAENRVVLRNVIMEIETVKPSNNNLGYWTLAFTATSRDQELDLRELYRLSGGVCEGDFSLKTCFIQDQQQYPSKVRYEGIGMGRLDIVL